MYERCPQIVYNDKKSNFNELLVKDGSVSIHHQNFQKTTFEIFKVSEIYFPKWLMNHFNLECKYLMK